MSVELNDWETSETSIVVPAQWRHHQRRRKRSSSDADVNNNKHDNGNREKAAPSLARDVAAAVSFVPNRRARGSNNKRHKNDSSSSRDKNDKKKKKQKKINSAAAVEDLHPVAVFTSMDSVGVVGKSSDMFIRESEQLHHSVRPGQSSSSFLPSSATGNQYAKETTQAPLNRIPALLDARTSRLYGVSQNNTVLWSKVHNDDQEDDDEEFIVSRADLKSPAQSLSLALLPDGTALAYGVLLDGTIFWVPSPPTSSSSSDGILKVEFMRLLSEDSTERQRSVGALAVAAASQTNTDLSSAKRKLDAVEHEHNPTMLTFYQVVTHGGARDESSKVWVLRKEVPLGPRLETTYTSSPTVRLAELSMPASWVNVDTVGFNEVDLQVTLRGFTSRTQRQQQICSFSLTSGTRMGWPITLPTNIQHVAIMGRSILALGTSERQIILLDAFRGGRIHAPIRLPSGGDELWCMATDSRRLRLGVLYSRQGDEKLYFAFATVNVDTMGASASTRTPALTLASGLASSASLSPIHPMKAPTDTRELGFGEGLTCRPLDARLQASMDLLESSIAHIQKSESLLDVFERALEVLRGVDEEMKLVAKSGKHHFHSNGFHQKKLSNGKTSALQKKQPTLNGSHSRQNEPSTPSDAPLAWIEFVLKHMLKILCGDQAPLEIRDDARIILRSLLRSKRLSARTCLQSPIRSRGSSSGSSFFNLLHAMERAQGETVQSYSPVTFLFEVFQVCSDISERHIGESLHYLLSRARSEDIATFFVQDHTLSADHPCRTLGKKYLKLQDKADEQEETRSLSVKLVHAVTCRFVALISKYSDFNETLLRESMNECLARTECIVVTRLFLKLLDEKLPLSADDARQNRKRIFRWLLVLCESLRSHLDSDSSGTVKDEISRIRQCVKEEIAMASAVSELQGLLSDKFLAQSSSNARQGERAEDDCIPPYQVERVVF